MKETRILQSPFLLPEVISSTPSMSTVCLAVCCDGVEDVAIAYGYNNIQRQAPPTNNIGSEQPINQLYASSNLVHPIGVTC